MVRRKKVTASTGIATNSTSARDGLMRIARIIVSTSIIGPRIMMRAAWINAMRTSMTSRVRRVSNEGVLNLSMLEKE